MADISSVVTASLVAIATVWASAAGAGSVQAADATLVVEAGNVPRADVPLCLVLPAGTKTARMTDQASGKPVTCQVTDGKLWWVLDRLPAGGRKAYTVHLGAKSAPTPGGVIVKKEDTRLVISIDSKPFAIYHYGPKLDWGHPLWRPCFFPVYGPRQAEMVRPFPLVAHVPAHTSRDHPHHTGIWVAYGSVNGVDNWAVGHNKGHQIHKGFDEVVSGPVMGMFRERLDWTDPAGKPNLAEVRTVRVYDLGSRVRMMDLEVHFEAKYGTVHFGDTKEGGICATRMRDSMRADGKYGRGGRLVNSNGTSGLPTWGKRADWDDASGLFDGHRVGYAIFDNPANLHHPTYWHSRTYGLLTANPFSAHCFNRRRKPVGYTLEAGQQITLRYRIYFHEGDVKQAAVAEHYADYADGPHATMRLARSASRAGR